jgi:hypothetical protein
MLPGYRRYVYRLYVYLLSGVDQYGRMEEGGARERIQRRREREYINKVNKSVSDV